jgi:hypothetical protein
MGRPRAFAPNQRTKVRLRLETLEERTLMSVDVGLTYQGTAYTGYYPPDTIAASGYNYVLEGVNSTLRYYDYFSGTQLFSTSYTSFFAPLGGVMSMSDPTLTFDEYTGQFVVGILDYHQSGSTFTASRFDLAVSNDDNPFDGWQYFRYDMHETSNCLSDYPRMGYNADGYFVAFNMFTPSFNHVDTLSINKGDLTTGYRVQVPGGASNFTLMPATEHQGNYGDPEWLVEVGTTSSIKVVQMTNEFANNPSYTFYTVGVPSFSNSVAATQMGSSFKITTNDDRILGAAMSNGQLVAVHTVSHSSIDYVRWYQFDTTNGAPVLAQEGEINPDGNTFCFFPSIEINYEGDIGVTYMESSSNEYLSIYVAGQSIYDNANTMQPGQLVFAGTSSYTLSRAGDYAGLTVDPNDGYTFWGANEYKGSSSWNTGIAQFGISAASPGAIGGHSGLNRIGLFTISAQTTAMDEGSTLTSAPTVSIATPVDSTDLATYDASGAVQPSANVVAMGLWQDAPANLGALTAADLDNLWNGSTI